MKILDRFNKWHNKIQNRLLRRILRGFQKSSIILEDDTYWILRNWYQSASFKYDRINLEKGDQLKLQAEKEMKEFLYTHPKVKLSRSMEEQFKTLQCYRLGENDNSLNDWLGENANSLNELIKEKMNENRNNNPSK